uniref:Transposase n=1 Tax=Knipowitschia caucasica TaxID=637954 RepID=A0AAV2K1R9_KNICA
MINDSIRPVQLSVDSLKEQVQDFTVRLTHTEALAGENFEKLTQAEGTIQSLEAQNKFLFERVDDLENRSRRSNLRIINIPEERGRNPVEFMSELLKECMGPDVFPWPPILERAHRTPGGSRSVHQPSPPRTFMVCFHYFQEKALRWAREHELKYKGCTLRVYPDLSAALAKKRAAFNAIKHKLYERKSIFHLFHPARLRVRVGDETRVFDTPKDAETWLFGYSNK